MFLSLPVTAPEPTYNRGARPFPLAPEGSSLTKQGQETIEKLSDLLDHANCVRECVFNDNFECILKYNKDKGQELPF